MSKVKLFAGMVVFIGLAGFVLGLLFLFLINVPLEALLQWAHASQGMIDIAMRVLIAFWAMSTVLLAAWFYHSVLTSQDNSGLALRIVIVLILLSTASFPVLVFKNSTPLNLLSGSVVDQGQRFSFGPYPDSAKLLELKEEGYSGVITLLSPVIPFEKVLLDKEISSGEQTGLKVYSFPMLPWVSDNQSALNQIKDLFVTKQGKFYVHCYLGRHRVKLVEQMLENDPQQTEQNTVFAYPDKLERGKLYNYRDAQIFLGPYPTDEEWFSLVLRGQIKEVISLLDPQNPENMALLEKEQKAVSDLGLKLTNFPLGPTSLAENAPKLADYLRNIDHKVFIHSFRIDDRALLVDGYLKNGAMSPGRKKLPETITGGTLYQINRNLIFGPEPNQQERDTLQSLGVTNIAKLDNNTLPIGVIVNNLIAGIASKQEVNYVYGFASVEQADSVYKAFVNRYYGINKTDFTEKVAGVGVQFINGRILLGGPPNLSELSKLASVGVKTVVMIKGRGSDSPAAFEELREGAEENGMEVLAVDYKRGYEVRIVTEALRDNNLVYVATPVNSLVNIFKELMEMKLY